MSCALWTFLGLWILLYNPTSRRQIVAYFALAGFSLLCALLQTIYRQHQELKGFHATPPEIRLTIENVVMHRTGDAEWRWRNGEFLIQISSELLNLPTATVGYSAQLVYRGEAIELTAIKDLQTWEIIERRYYKNFGAGIRQSFVTNPVPITESLIRSRRNEGWLHFQIVGMGETEIAKRTLRLYATSKSGGCHVDEDLAQHHVVASELVAMRKHPDTWQSPSDARALDPPMT